METLTAATTPNVNGSTKMVLEAHPLALLVPAMDTEDFSRLVESIRAHGFGENAPIILYEGKILDGCNRYRAAEIAGVKPATRHWEPGYEGDTPADFVIRTNILRRHLTKGQLAMCTVALAKEAGISYDETARRFGIGTSTVDRAAAVEKLATPELKAAVRDGDVPVETAAKLAKAPVETQKQVVATVRKIPDKQKRAGEARKLGKCVAGASRSETSQRDKVAKQTGAAAEKKERWVLVNLGKHDSKVDAEEVIRRVVGEIADTEGIIKILTKHAFRMELAAAKTVGIK